MPPDWTKLGEIGDQVVVELLVVVCSFHAVSMVCFYIVWLWDVTLKISRRNSTKSFRGP